MLLAAGDIADCRERGDEQTAELLDQLPGTVAALGDTAYQAATQPQMDNCYGPTWGRQKARTRPAPGNHEYGTPGAAGFFGYFGAAAGDPKRGYYSYDLGAWHVVVLNSNCEEAGGCAEGSPQERWLRADLRSHPAACTLAYWHHPRFSSGTHGGYDEMAPMWGALYDAGADVVLSAHDHDYERFAPQRADGVKDLRRGIREFVVGTGGKTLNRIRRPAPNSEVRNDDTFGVLRLALHPEGYDWRFIPVDGDSFTDAGSAPCVGAAPPGASVAGTAVPPGRGAAPVFADGFESGDLSAWTSEAGLAIQGAVVSSGRYAARGRTEDGETYAKKSLPGTYGDGYARVYVRLGRYADEVNLLRLRAADDESIAYLFVDERSKLNLHVDAGDRTRTSTATVGGGWHALELHARIGGEDGMVEVWLDGRKVGDLSGRIDLGERRIIRMQIGEVEAGRRYDVAFDDAAFDTRRIGLR